MVSGKIGAEAYGQLRVWAIRATPLACRANISRHLVELL
jgi:hypothetical protein